MALWSRRSPQNAPAWFARLRGEGTAPASDSRLRRWLQADPRNDARFEQQELVWKIAGELEHDPEIEGFLEEIEAPVRTVAARSIPGRRLAFAAVACALPLFAIGLGVWSIFRVDREQLYATGIGEERTIALPDHSMMTLNTATRVRVSYGGSRRSVILDRGEATFNVVHDASRSFEVAAAGGTARALGTQFNVLASGNRITVAVLEGRVAVSAAHTSDQTNAAGSTLVVSDGEQVTYAGARLEQPQPANVARIRGWHAGRIVLNNVELGEAIAEFNRYSRLPVQVGNSALLTHRITGVFRTGETDAFLVALQEAFNVRVERSSTAIVLH